MKEYNIEFSNEARKDLIDIFRYIKINLQETNIAEKLLKKIKKSIYGLSKSPYIYAIIDNEYTKILQLRKITVNNYIIFFKIIDKENKVLIVRILYGRRNWLNLL